MTDLILILALLLILGAAAGYIWKSKKSGKKCIGCPYAGSADCHCSKK